MSFPDLETARKAIREVLEQYIGRAAITPVFLVQLHSSIQTCLIKLHAETDGNVEPYFTVSALEARGMGREVPERVPDCATAQFAFDSPRADQIQPDRVVLKLLQKTEWKWFELDFTV